MKGSSGVSNDNFRGYKWRGDDSSEKQDIRGEGLCIS